MGDNDPVGSSVVPIYFIGSVRSKMVDRYQLGGGSSGLPGLFLGGKVEEEKGVKQQTVALPLYSGVVCGGDGGGLKSHLQYLLPGFIPCVYRRRGGAYTWTNIGMTRYRLRRVLHKGSP
jgi:hypothetical protein